MNPHDPMIEPNDPRLTDYVLGELAPNEIAQIEDALKSSPQLRAAVADIRRATESITSVFQAEPSLQLAPEQRIKLLDEAESASNTDVHSFADNVTPTVTGEHYQPAAGSTAHWLKIAVAAGLAGLLLGGAYYFTESERLPIAASERPALDSDAELDESELFDSSQEQFHFEIEGKGAEFPLESSSLNEPSPLDESKAPTRNRDTDRSDNALPPAASDAAGAKSSETEKQDLYAPKAFSKSRSGLGRTKPVAALPSRNDLRKAKSSFKESDRFPAKIEAVAQSNNIDRSSQLPKVESPLTPKPFVTKKALKRSELNLASNAATPLRAQQSLDQSTLGPLNLRVVALDRPVQFQPSVGGGGEGGGRHGVEGFGGDVDADGDSLQLMRANQNLSKNKPTQRKALESLPTTFELKISDQDALRVVQLLASQADPLQQRRLSFDELIGLQKSPQNIQGAIAGKVELLDGFDDASDDDELELEADAAATGDKTLLEQSKPQAAAMMLASKLRGHVVRPSVLFSNGQSLQYFEDLSKEDVAEASDPRSSVLPPAAPGRSTGSPLVAPGQEAKPRFLANEPMEDLRSIEFNFEYTQVIQQLKSNLKIRNQSVVIPRHSPARQAP